MVNTAEQWRQDHPEVFFLDPARPERLAGYLTVHGVLESMEIMLSAERAGEGNMNCTLRVRTNRRSFVVKQSRPWVEKYPQFEAPWDRTLREIEFYQVVATRPDLAAMMPALLYADTEARLIVLEDLGDGGDYTDLYRGADIGIRDLECLGQFLGALHAAFLQLEDHRGLANREMRALNSQHIFHIPLDPENGLDLDAITPGLAGVADALTCDRAYVEAVRGLAEIYEADGPCLLHGDFFPGSIMRTAFGPRVIDPEFGYFGRPEFDPAVMVAHLLIAGRPPAQIHCFLDAYHPPGDYDERIMLQFAGVEIMRRLIGYAQLPVSAALERKRHLLALSRRLVLEPASNLFTDPKA